MSGVSQLAAVTTHWRATRPRRTKFSRRRGRVWTRGGGGFGSYGKKAEEGSDPVAGGLRCLREVGEKNSKQVLAAWTSPLNNAYAPAAAVTLGLTSHGHCLVQLLRSVFNYAPAADCPTALRL